MSKTIHVKYCLKTGGSSSKPKNNSIIDSVLVPWGKGEKEFCEVEKHLKPYAYKQLELF
jgi:hypothetical protein